MAQANNGVVIQHVGEAFLTQVNVNEMPRDQLEIRAIRMILDGCFRRNLPAVSASFIEIADIESVAMNLSNLRVVPACINLLTGLRDLYLSCCKLNRDDSFPDTFWQLTGLKRLSLHCNKLTSIPSQIGQLSSLTFLDLSDNNLVSLPDEIYQLTNLTELFLDDNKLQSISEDIGNLTKLIYLELCSNQLKKLPKAIGKLINLRNEYGLWIHDNPLITSLPDSIRKIKHALYNPYNEFKFNAMVDHAEYRVEQRVQRRLVIILAKEPKEATHQAVKDKIVSFITDILKDPKLVRLICEYMDWKPFLDEPQQQLQH